MSHQTNEYLGVDCNGIGPAECVQLAAEEADHWRTAYDDLHYRVDCLLERLLRGKREAECMPSHTHSWRVAQVALGEALAFAADFRGEARLHEASPTTMKKDTNEAGPTERRMVPRRAGSEPGYASDELERRVLILEWRVGCMVTHIGWRNPNLQAALDRGPKL